MNKHNSQESAQQQPKLKLAKNKPVPEVTRQIVLPWLCGFGLDELAGMGRVRAAALLKETTFPPAVRVPADLTTS